MPIDPEHGRELPAGTDLAKAIRLFLRSARQHAFDRVRFSQTIAIDPVAQSYFAAEIAPILQKYVIEGALSSVGSGRYKQPPKISTVKPVQSLTAVSGSGEPPRIMAPPIRVSGPDLSRAWSLYLPQSKVQANKLALNLSGQLTETIRDDVRKAVAIGVEKGEPLSRVQANIMQVRSETTIADRVESLPVFSSDRAYTIAATETSRAVHAGQASHGKLLGSAGLEWLASSDACPVCLSINGKKVKHGEPFYVWPNAKKTEYKYVWYPPAHPSCMCTVNDWYDIGE